MNPGNLKIIIWDLDNTLWDSNLSQHGGPIRFGERQSQLLQKAHAHGIVNFLITHNDKHVFEKANRGNQVFEKYFFGFRANFAPKAPQIDWLLNTIGLRPSSAIFIDDSEFNLNSVEALIPGIHLGKPTVELFDRLQTIISRSPMSSMSRKTKYEGALKRVEISDRFESYERFLHSSEITLSYVDFKRYRNQLEPRRNELLRRAHQLNYTRMLSGEDRKRIMKQGGHIYLMVYARDKYGDHGAIGFVAFGREKIPWRFVFSCRVIGTGVPSFVYQDLKLQGMEYERERVAEEIAKEKPHWIRAEINPNRLVSKKQEMFPRPKIVTGSLCYYQSFIRRVSHYSVTTMSEFRAINLLFLDDWGLDYDVAVMFLVNDHLDRNYEAQEEHFLSVAGDLAKGNRFLILAPPVNLFRYAKNVTNPTPSLSKYTSDKDVERWHKGFEERLLRMKVKCEEISEGSERVYLLDTASAVEHSIDEKGAQAFSVPEHRKGGGFFNHARFTHWLGLEAASKIDEMREEGMFLI